MRFLSVVGNLRESKKPPGSRWHFVVIPRGWSLKRPARLLLWHSQIYEVELAEPHGWVRNPCEITKCQYTRHWHFVVIPRGFEPRLPG